MRCNLRLDPLAVTRDTVHFWSCSGHRSISSRCKHFSGNITNQDKQPPVHLSLRQMALKPLCCPADSRDMDSSHTPPPPPHPLGSMILCKRLPRQPLSKCTWTPKQPILCKCRLPGQPKRRLYQRSFLGKNQRTSISIGKPNLP